jgi:hypothetical protein
MTSHGTSHTAFVPTALAVTASIMATATRLSTPVGSLRRHMGARWRSRSRNGGGIMTRGATDMSTPVTRGELREELDLLDRKFDNKLDLLDRKFDNKLDLLDRKFDNKLDLWGGALLARIAESEKRVINELARHTQAVFESMTTQISVVDEKYKDLPERTARLEAEVGALKQR